MVPYFLIDDMFSFNELYLRSSALLLLEPPVPLPSLYFGTDEWSPWPMTRPKIVARQYELDIARAQLGVIIRDMLDFQTANGASICY